VDGDFRIGEWLIRPQLGHFEGPNGKRLSIEPKAMEVLVYLAQHPGEVLPKERIIQAVWPDTFIEDCALTTAISKLRKALGDDAKNPSFIETLPKRGFRLILPVVEVTPIGRSGLKTGYWILTVLVLALAVVVVLLWPTRFADRPALGFEERDWILISNFENNTGKEIFEGSVKAAVRQELANSRYVLVTPANRIQDILELMKLPPETSINAKLGRTICLRDGNIRGLATGRVDKFGTGYRLSLELVDPVKGLTVASTVEEATTDAEVLAAVHRLGNWIREELGESLSRIKPSDELQKVTTRSLRALQLYSKGWDLATQYSPPKWAEAESYFREAVVVDPDFASAHIFVFHALHSQKKPKEEWFPFVQRAMELSDFVSTRERYNIQSNYYWWGSNEPEKACLTFRTLADLYPDHPYAIDNVALVCQGYVEREDTVKNFVRGAELRPQKLNRQLRTAHHLAFTTGDFEAARIYVKRMEELVEEIPSRGTPVRGAKRFMKIFPAEEYLNKKDWPAVLAELERLEHETDSLDDRAEKSHLRLRIAQFYLALGRFQKVREFTQDSLSPERLRICLAFLRGDRTKLAEGVEERVAFWRRGAERGEPSFLRILSNKKEMLWLPPGTISTAELDTVDEPARSTKMKLQLLRGTFALAESRTNEGLILLREAVGWLKGYSTFVEDNYSLYFLGSELLAEAYIHTRNLETAKKHLEIASEMRELVWSESSPFHLRVQARLVQIYQELGQFEDADAVEAELLEALQFADEDHPILRLIREQRNTLIPLMELEQ